MALSPTVLITCAAQNAALAGARSLHAAGWRVALADDNPRAKAFASRACREQILLRYSPAEKPEQYAAEILQYLTTHRTDVLIPITDAAIFALLPHEAELRDLTSIPWPAPAAVREAADKVATLRLGGELGLCLPQTVALDDPDRIPADLKFPLVIKPHCSLVDGQKMGVVYAATPAELHKIISRLPAAAFPLMLQQRVIGPGEGYFGVWEHGRPVVEFAHRRRRENPPSGGVSTLREAIELPDDMRVAAHRLLEHWQWHGPAMVEFKRGSDGQPYLMEVNGRLWGSLQLAVDAGIDIPLASALVARGEPVPPMKFKPGVLTRWLFGDIDAMLIRMVLDDRKLNLPPGTPSRWSVLRDFFLDFFRPQVRLEEWRWHDPGPFFVEARNWFSNNWRVFIKHLRRRPGSKAVLHVHSNFSYDGETGMDELARLLRRRGVKICCLTEHQRGLDDTAIEKLKHACERESGPDLLLTPGLEYETVEGFHVLGLGVTKLMPNADLQTICEAIHTAGGIAVLAHPRPASLTDQPQIMRSLDGIEIWNTSHNGSYVPDVQTLAAFHAARTRSSIPCLALQGVDFHRPGDLRHAGLLLDVPRLTWPEVRKAILDGHYIITNRLLQIGSDGVPAWQLPVFRAFSTAIKLLRKLKHGFHALYEVPCWEYFGCDDLQCPARSAPDGGLICWRVVGSFSGEKKHSQRCRELENCAACDFYREQAADAHHPPRCRVLHLIETGNPGGAERMMLNLIDGLDPARFSSQVLLLKSGWLEQQVRRQGTPLILMPLRGGFDWRFILKLIQIIRRRRIDVLHSHEFAMNVYSFLAGRLAWRGTLATVHGNLAYLTARYRRRLAYRLLAYLAGPMIVVSTEMKDQLGERFGIPFSRIKVIANGVRIAEPAITPEARDKFRDQLGLPRRSFLIGTIGSLYPVKNQKTMIEAMPHLVAEHPEVHLAIVGRGQMRAELEKLTETLDLAGHITFTGYQENIREMLTAFDLIVVPSRYEGLSLLLLEAMVQKLPVVATRVGGNAEAIIDGQSGLLVPPDDPAALAAACLRILEHPELAGDLGQGALRRVRENFTFEQMVREYENLYLRLKGKTK